MQREKKRERRKKTGLIGKKSTLILKTTTPTEIKRKGSKKKKERRGYVVPSPVGEGEGGKKNHEESSNRLLTCRPPPCPAKHFRRGNALHTHNRREEEPGITQLLSVHSSRKGERRNPLPKMEKKKERRGQIRVSFFPIDGKKKKATTYTDLFEEERKEPTTGFHRCSRTRPDLGEKGKEWVYYYPLGRRGGRFSFCKSDQKKGILTKYYSTSLPLARKTRRKLEKGIACLCSRLQGEGRANDTHPKKRVDSLWGASPL